MDIKRNGSQPSGKGPEENLTALCVLTRYSRRLTRHARVARVSHSSPAPAPHGTRIRLGRR